MKNNERSEREQQTTSPMKRLADVQWGEQFRDPDDDHRWLTMWEGLDAGRAGVVSAISDKNRVVYRRMGGWQEVEVR